MGLYDDLANFLANLGNGDAQKTPGNYAEGDAANAMSRLSADRTLDSAPGLSPRDAQIAARGDMGSGAEEMRAGGAPISTGKYAADPFNGGGAKSPAQPKSAGGKTPQLLDIPKVDPGASGVVDATVPAAPAVTKAPAVFRVTPAQSKALGPLYGNNVAGMNDHIVYSIAKGDHTLGPYTPEQLAAYRQRGVATASGQQYPDQQRGTFQSILGAALQGAA